MGNQRAARAPDNNKRLALLETSVSALAIALVANGVALAEGADPIEAAITRIKQAGELADKLGGTTAELENLKAKSAEEANDGALEQLKARIAELEEAAGNSAPGDATAALEDQIDELERQLAAKTARIVELEAGAPVIVNTVTAEEPEEVPIGRERPETARDVGPEYGGALSSAELTTLLASGTAEELEIAFSNGEYEVVSLHPVKVEPKDLQLFEGRNVVGPAIDVHLAAIDPAEILHGFGLLMGGEQIAYCPLLDPIRLEPGTEHRFQRVIFF